MSNDDNRNELYNHISTEFFAWLLYQSEVGEGEFSYGKIGNVEVVMQDRLSFESPTENKMRAVITGDDAACSAETKAALSSGKTIQDVKLHLRLEAATYGLSLKGGRLDISGFKQEHHEADEIAIEKEDLSDALLILRMDEYNVIWDLIHQLFLSFTDERLSTGWQNTLEKMRIWVHQAE
jgi:hypothetical protein